MAFNPFHSFRRYQKVIFATMAIVCMVLFVLSSGAGGGDLLNQFTDFFSRRATRTKDTVASLDGTKIDGQKLAYTRSSRQLADRFLSQAVNSAHGRILAAVFEQMNSLDPALQNLLRQFLFLMERGGSLRPDQFFSMLTDIQAQLIRHRSIIEAGNAANKKDQITIVQNMILLIDRQRQRFERAITSPQDGYFGGDPSKQSDNLDFLVWKAEADRLGIHFSKDAVASAISMEMLGQPITPEQSKQLERQLRQEFGDFYTVDRLNEALADEFRVRMAKSSIGGERGNTRTAPPVEATPEELFSWYQDVRTMVRVGLIEVPVARMLEKVTETPTDAQLKELYEKHKNDEYDPRLERPGFKEPRMVKVEWFAAPTDAGFYKQAAEAVTGPLFQAMRQWGNAANATTDGSPLAALGTIMALHPSVGDARLAFHFSDYMGAVPSWLDPYAFGRRSGIHDSSVFRAENIATLVGSTVGGLATGAGPFSGPASFEQRVVVREIRDRAKIGGSIILAALLDPAPFGIDALALHLIPPPVTEQILRSEMVQREKEFVTGSLMRADLTKFREELAKRSKEQDANNVQAFINEFIHTRQFNRGGTASAVNRFALPTDAGVATLRPVFERSTRQSDPLGAFFAQQLADFGPGNRFLPMKPENFAPEQIEGDNIVYTHWRSEDRLPKMITFDQARAQVEAAWRFQKARELARKEADRIAIEAKAAGGDVQKLRDMALQTSPRGLIELDPMAVWNTQISFSGASGPNYTPPFIPDTKISYAGSNFGQQLVDLRKRDVGATEVVSDFPKANFFVAALLNKDVPTMDAFRMTYRGWQGPPTLRDPLFDILIGERRQQYKTELVKQLRTDHKLEVFKDEKGNPTDE